MGVSAIVGVIGLSSLTAVRLQHRDVDARADATQAAILADSALRVVHARLSTEDAWRSTHTHDTWSTEESLGTDAVLRYKLADESDSDLADNSDDPARLTVRVVYGDAVRLASIQVGGGDPLGRELTDNSDMENGTTGYESSSGFSGNVVADTTNPHGGWASLVIENRFTALAAWKQDFTIGTIESGKTYRVSAWMRLENSAENVKIGLLNSASFTTDYKEITAPGNTTWTLIEGDLTPEFTFTPTSSYFYGTTASSNQDIHFDDVSVREVLADGLPVVRGSYRRELDR